MVRRFLALATFPVFAVFGGCGDDGGSSVDAAVVVEAGPSGTPDVPRPLATDAAIPVC